jgi:hypothetical protein
MPVCETGLRRSLDGYRPLRDLHERVNVCYQCSFMNVSFKPAEVFLLQRLHLNHCHRRLVAEYLQDKWGDVEVVHL